MMMNYTMIALWGVVNVLQTYKIFQSIIVYEINRRRDKKLYAKNIYITRSDRSEIIVLAVALPMTPALMFMVHLLGDIGFHFLYDVGAFLFTCFLLYVFNETAGSYTKSRRKDSKRTTGTTIKPSTRSTRSIRSRIRRVPTVKFQTPSPSTRNRVSALRVSGPSMRATPSSQ